MPPSLPNAITLPLLFHVMERLEGTKVVLQNLAEDSPRNLEWPTDTKNLKSRMSIRIERATHTYASKDHVWGLNEFYVPFETTRISESIKPIIEKI